jgi:hypothetical protein
LVKYAKADDTPEEVEAIGKQNVAAVSTCIMAGAELGLPPMVSLRAFTVINGKPALYADGNVAVVRKAKTPEGKHIAEFLKTGYTEVRDLVCPVCKGRFADLEQATAHMLLTDDEAHTRAEKKLNDAHISYAKAFTLTEPTDKSFAWCEAKRSDNGEIYRETFSIEDAKRAALWDDNPHKRAKVWKDKKTGTGREQVWVDDAPNDAVWFRYPRRMMMWRAVGYCLRWLFADVLGGMADEYESREIEGMIDITPAATPRQIERPQPPVQFDDEQTEEGTIISGTSNEGEKINTPAPDTSDLGKSLADIDAQLAEQHTTAGVEEAFDKFDVQIDLADDEEGLTRAFTIKATHKARAEREELEAEGQESMFPGDR